MQDYYRQFEKRKQDHIRLALKDDNQAYECNLLDKCKLIHEALPDLNFKDISIDSLRFAKKVATPFLVSSMTAGHDEALRINYNLMQACTMQGWAMGVGSQRRELSDDIASLEWKALRKEFADISLMSNLGIAQLITTDLASIHRILDVIKAEALIIHCNPLQEVIQLEGTPDFQGCLDALKRLKKDLNIPLVIKETGCGFSVETLKRLQDVGVDAVDVSGLGGTHWGRIEGARADNASHQQLAAQTFSNWGINTVESIQNAFFIKPSFEVWGSGGVRHGLDAAKLLALGTTTIGFARLMLEAAIEDVESVVNVMKLVEYELKIAMFCTGSAVLNDLKGKICL